MVIHADLILRMKGLFRKEVMEKDVLNRIKWDKKNFRSGNFCARKTAKQFLGPKNLHCKFLGPISLKANSGPISPSEIRAQSEPKGSDSDNRLNPADFDIYYLDRITNKLNRVKFTDIKLEGDFFSIDKSLIPLHRIIRGVASELRGHCPRIRKILARVKLFGIARNERSSFVGY